MHRDRVWSYGFLVSVSHWFLFFPGNNFNRSESTDLSHLNPWRIFGLEDEFTSTILNFCSTLSWRLAGYQQRQISKVLFFLPLSKFSIRTENPLMWRVLLRRWLKLSFFLFKITEVFLNDLAERWKQSHRKKTVLSPEICLNSQTAVNKRKGLT